MKKSTNYYLIFYSMFVVLAFSGPAAMAVDTYTTITSPSDGSSIYIGDSLNITADVVDPDGINVVRLWVDGSVHSLLNNAPFNYTVDNLALGDHDLHLVSKDLLGNLLQSDTITISVINTPAAYATITSPTNGSNITLGESLSVTADVFDPDGINVVRLWLDGSFYSMLNNAPFNYTVDNLALGDHDLHLVSKDLLGNLLQSDTVTISVSNPPAAYATITSPTNGSTITLGESLSVTADVFDPDGINVVRLWVDGSVHSLLNNAPFNYTVDNLTLGDHDLYLVSKDLLGNLLQSDTVTITVVNPTYTGEIKLPVEVLGAASGKEKSITVNIGANDLTDISHLYLRCNACGYHDVRLDKDSTKNKAVVRVNGGNEIALNHFIEGSTVYGNQAIQVIGGEANYGGIGGGFRTVRFTVPVNGLVAGDNILTFEHRDLQAPSIGFRILELNFLRNGDLNNKVFDESVFSYDDPNDWVAPRESATDISDGYTLWKARDSLYDLSLDIMDGSADGQGTVNGDMKASCADCHSNDGRDLKYFNFSNDSIIERSKFHGLTQIEGEQIASYIRDLNLATVDSARPWNPTYQPGPGLDSRPAYEWAAGAGVDAILDDDTEIQPYLFPNGTSLNNVRDVVDRFATLNFRELPITLAMPEWNQWLPIIHPDDAFDITDNDILADYRGNDVGMPYYKKLLEDALANPNKDTIGAMAPKIKSWLSRGQSCTGVGEGMRSIDGAVMTSLAIPGIEVNSSNCSSVKETTAVEPHEIAKRGLTAWMSVKMWDIMHGHSLEEESTTRAQNICSSGQCINASEVRGWVAEGRNVFDRPPHFIGTAGGRKFFTQNSALGILESNVWYHLNMILNPGYRENMPSHFAYTYSHVELLQQYTDIDQGFRFWATMIKQRQLQTNGQYGVEAGLDLRTAQPYIYYGTGRNTTNTDAQSSVGPDLWGKLAQAMVEDFVADADNATAQNWADANQNRKVQARNSTNFSRCSGTCTFDLGQYQGLNTYRVIPKLREIGVDNTAINDLIDWGLKTWPNGPWDGLRQ
jgi:hypothetical protein